MNENKYFKIEKLKVLMLSVIADTLKLTHKAMYDSSTDTKLESEKVATKAADACYELLGCEKCNHLPNE